MEDMAREVLAIEHNRNAPKFPSKVAPVSLYKSQYRNAHKYPRKTASRYQSRTATVFLDRAVPVCPYRHLPR